MKFNWIVDNAENLWLVLSTYFFPTGCDYRHWIVWLWKLCAFCSSVSCIFLFAPLVNSSRITHIMMTLWSISLPVAPWQQGTIQSCQDAQPVLPSYRHWVSSASFVTVNLRANTLLPVTAVNRRHSLARSVQTQGASDHYIWQNARMFRLEFFAITVLPP